MAYAFQSQVCVNASMLEGQDLAGVISASQNGLVTEGQLLAHQGDAAAHHSKTVSFLDLNDQASDGQIPAGITRDSEVLALILTIDGSGSGLDADLLDGLDSTDFALPGDVFGLVLDNDGAGSGLIADMLDGVHAVGFLRSNADDTYTGNTLTVQDGSSLVIERDMAIGPASVTSTSISLGDANNTVRFAGSNLTIELGDSAADNVEVPGEIIAGGPLTLTSGTNRYLPVPAAAFSPSHAVSDEGWFYSTGFGYMQNGTSPWSVSLTAPVGLPDGAEIEALRCYWYDNAGGGVNLNLDVTLPACVHLDDRGVHRVCGHRHRSSKYEHQHNRRYQHDGRSRDCRHQRVPVLPLGFLRHRHRRSLQCASILRLQAHLQRRHLSLIDTNNAKTAIATR